MSQSAFFWPGDSFITTLMPASCARFSTGSSALPSFGTTPMTSTCLAMRSSMARTCSAGSSVVGLIMVASTPRSLPACSTPFSTLSNQGIFTLPTTPICGGSLAASAPTGAERAGGAERGGALHQCPA